jgi:hypothetical protein
MVQSYTIKILPSEEVIQVIPQKEAQRHWVWPEVADGMLNSCIWPASHAYTSYWEYPLTMMLSPGDYLIQVYRERTEPIIDGAYDWQYPEKIYVNFPWIDEHDLVIHVTR